MKLHRDLREFIELLNAHKAEYVVIGGWAFGFHATPRYTADFDFLLKCDQPNAERLEKCLRDFGLGELAGFRESFLRGNRIIQFGIPPHRIDLLTDISGVNFTEAWATRVLGEIDGISLPFISRDCLIRNKLAAGRAKDLADVESLRRIDPQG